ncbi:MAG: carbamoyl-phosphate synthase small subunit [Proteobacteria bacterium]|nr:carbamoyl-phosphate synthase small subunit [Pseudomonadota bacterium]NDC24724.1 carbamoyl-phosphate synthase small subunit [Pseudomonadota bacterium]NDD04839.1 carbamoyl-phosphate synthase small subunit [Pseudomonadota bacterium]NDG27465.1 carbamoyl-phosphate synthase small subunit [Pseudomonadota bacterium]
MPSHGWNAALYLENGHLFLGKGFGARQARGGEAVFNTGMTGYQEIFSDPSYSHQVVVLTSTQVGNYGINPEDTESETLLLKGVVAREYFSEPSNWRAQQNLGDYLEKSGVPGISEVDTRRITQILRDEGAQRSIIFPIEKETRTEIQAKAQTLLGKIPAMEGLELVSQVSCKVPWEFDEKKNKSRNTLGTMVVYDYGVKWNILRSLSERGFKVRVVPYQMPHQEVLKEKPAAVCLSNGPGDPARVPSAIHEIQGILGKLPVLAICMGHQLLARALGGETYKLKFGHHGVNHPVQELETGRIMITSQNHGFAVNADSLPQKDVKISLINLNDRTVEGFVSTTLRFSSIQFHPEAKPGPSDANFLFDNFLKGFVK